MTASRSDPADRWQWRTTRSLPSGEWIDSTARPPQRSAAAERTKAPDSQGDGFLMSSFDLLSGLDVREADEEMLSEFDQLFPNRVR